MNSKIKWLFSEARYQSGLRQVATLKILPTVKNVVTKGGNVGIYFFTLILELLGAEYNLY